MLEHIARAIPHDADNFVGDYNIRHGVRTILQDAVFGLLTRDRSRCINAACLVVRDSLHNSHLVLKLAFPDEHRAEKTTRQPLRITLQEMWEYHFGERKYEWARAHCGTLGVRQSFLEGEPPLLIIKLERGVEVIRSVAKVRKKIQSAVEFPEPVDVMRTGEYALCGVVLHHGECVNAGRYNVACRMAEIGSTPAAKQHAYCFLIVSGLEQKCVHGMTCAKKRRRSVCSCFCMRG